MIGGESSQWWGPMGVAVICGLAVATFLTLVVVPVLYSLSQTVALRGWVPSWHRAAHRTSGAGPQPAR